ncbi:MAG: sugar ABC transporter permease [Oscillospiraceae bacterium]|nr:sugar ABC transporter permease [Oscillospiraceae bacterium]
MKQHKRFAGFCKRNRHILYIVPWIIGFLCFQALPMLYSLLCGFTDFHLFRGITKIGLMQYQRILTDAEVLRAIGITLLYTGLVVPLKILTALFIACLLNRSMKGIRVFRTLYYLPSILGGSIAASILWKALFRDHGFINQILSLLHLPEIAWLAEPNAALWVIILLRVWEFGSPMVLLLAALEQIPTSLIEAARLDGAGAISIFFRIRLPMISPVLFYTTMIQLCAALQEFNAPFVITDGGPRGSTTLISLLLYRSAFTEYQMGYASAMAWVLFLLTTVLVGVFLLTRNRLVFYQEEGGGI